MSRIKNISLVLAFTLVAASCTSFGAIWGPGGSARPYWCDPTDTAINDGHGGGNFDLAYTQPKGPLSATDCQSVTSNILAAESFVAQYPTVADAEAGGFRQAAGWAAGQGIHYVDPNRLLGPFDPSSPNWLMYDGTSPSSNITGMMFLLDTGTTSPPPGFAGDNDHWHQHGPLCTDPTPGAYPFIIGEHMTDAECAAIGGFNLESPTIWMVHVWLPIYQGWVPDDIFNKSHPLLP